MLSVTFFDDYKAIRFSINKKYQIKKTNEQSQLIIHFLINVLPATRRKPKTF